MARSNKAPKTVTVKVGGVPCTMARKPGKAYAAMLKGDRLGKLSTDTILEREAEWAASEVQRLVGLTIDRNYGEALKAWHYRAVSAYYSAMTKLGRPVVPAATVDESEPELFEAPAVEVDEVEPDLVAIRQARALEMGEAAEVSPLDTVLGFAEFVEACDAEDARPVVEFGAIEAVVEEQPVRDLPALEVVPDFADAAEMHAWLADRPGAAPHIERTFLHVSAIAEAEARRDRERAERRVVPPADKVPSVPFMPRKPAALALADAFRERYGRAA